MLNTKTVLRRIQQTVTEKINSGKMFTAYDITRLVQKDGVNIRHLVLRDYVHQCIADMLPDNWSKTSVFNGQINDSFFVYHQNDLDPRDYKIEAQPIRMFSLGVLEHRV
jgi:hypothetical protein